MTSLREPNAADADPEPRRSVDDVAWSPDGAEQESPEPTPSLGPRYARPPVVAAEPGPDRLPLVGWIAAAAVPPLVGLGFGPLGFQHGFAALIVALVVERLIAVVTDRHRRVLGQQRAMFEAQVRERTTELELANIALRHEIERRNEVQRQLVDAERLAVAGGVAAGVCHEIRNPLAALMGNLELAVERVDEPGAGADTRALLLEAMEGARQVEAVTGDLQTLARPGADVGVAEVRASVQAALRLAMPYLRASCDVQIEVQAGNVSLPPSRLVQILLNLLINAAKATRPDTNNVVRVRTVPTDLGFVAIEVQDSGVGMDSAVQQRVFEPFFTTRRQQGGTGLGLYLSRTIARGCGGSLTFRSAPGAGTTFRVTLPAVD